MCWLRSLPIPRAYVLTSVRKGRTTITLARGARIRLGISSTCSLILRSNFVAQNGHYDASWLWFKDRIRVHQHWFDTMLAHHYLYPGLPHDLGFITAQYTDHPYYKDEGQLWKEEGDIDAFWEYNVTDCCITRIAAEKMQQELIDAGLTRHVPQPCHATAA